MVTIERWWKLDVIQSWEPDCSGFWRRFSFQLASSRQTERQTRKQMRDALFSRNDTYIKASSKDRTWYRYREQHWHPSHCKFGYFWHRLVTLSQECCGWEYRSDYSRKLLITAGEQLLTHTHAYARAHTHAQFCKAGVFFKPTVATQICW